jgi:hypothetical protein
MRYTLRRHVVRRLAVRIVIPTVSVGLMSATATQFMLPTVRPAAFVVRDAAAIVVSPDTVGFSDGDLYGMTPAEIQANLALVQSTGSDTIRIDIPWSAVEPTNGTYNWTEVDDIVDAASADGIAIDAVLNDTPAWAATPGTPAISGPPASDGQFATFASAVASRYGTQISAYEIWNEPNSVQNWSTGPNAAAYTALLQAAYPAIKAADPSAIVVAGVLGSTVSVGDITENPVTFLSQMYADGAEGYFDALSFHPYSYTQEFSQGTTTANSPIEQLEAIRALMVANGDSNKLIWATEYGLPTSTVSQQTQATFIGDFLNTWSGLSYAGPSFIYTLQDTSATNTLDPSDSFGVFNVDGTAKAAVAVIEQFIAAHTVTSVTSLGAALAAALEAAVQAYANAIATAISNYFAALGAGLSSATQALTVKTSLVTTTTPGVVEVDAKVVTPAAAATPEVTPAVVTKAAVVTTPATVPAVVAAVTPSSTPVAATTAATPASDPTTGAASPDTVKTADEPKSSDTDQSAGTDVSTDSDKSSGGQGKQTADHTNKKPRATDQGSKGTMNGGNKFHPKAGLATGAVGKAPKVASGAGGSG